MAGKSLQEHLSKHLGRKHLVKNSIPDELLGLLLSFNMPDLSNELLEDLERVLASALGAITHEKLIRGECRHVRAKRKYDYLNGPVFDHREIWENGDFINSVMGNPYSLGTDDIKYLLELSNEHYIHISGQSPYFPGRTLCVSVTRKDEV